jgi:hypothetical protein
VSLFAYVPPDIWDDLASLPAILPGVALAGSVVFGAAALWSAASLARAWRRTDDATKRDRGWQIVALLAIAALLPSLAARIADAETVRRQAPSVNIVLLWLLLAWPALRQAPRPSGVRWAKWISLAVADLAVGGALIGLWASRGFELSLPFFAGFVALSHAAAGLDAVARGGGQRVFWRFAALLALLFVTADFFVPPAVEAGRRARDVAAIRTVAAGRNHFREAFFNYAGDVATVATTRGRLQIVRVATGEVKDAPADATPPIRLLSIDPLRQSVTAAFDPAAPLGLQDYFAGDLKHKGAYRGGLPFTTLALLNGDRFIMAAGEGPRANARLCAAFEADFGATKPAEEMCHDLRLPFPRVGSLTATLTRGVIYAAEGDRWLSAGKRLLMIRAADASPRRLETIGPGIGGMAIDAKRNFLFVARPRLGVIEGRALDTLRSVGGMVGEPGDDLLAYDGERNLLLAANPHNGYLNIYDPTRGKRVARAPIGPGISNLDYHRPTAAALLCTERGLVLVKILELPEMLTQ